MKVDKREKVEPQKIHSMSKTFVASFSSIACPTWGALKKNSILRS